MSLRDEDRHKNTCPSRGLGIAAAAIGVGVGAAMYYFFSKRPENPSTEGSSSRDWNSESPSMLYDLHEELYHSDNSYTTISVNTTTDTSMHETDLDTSSDTELESDSSPIISISDISDVSDMSSFNSDFSDSYSHNSDYNRTDVISDSDMSEWDETSSLATPNYEVASCSRINSYVGDVMPLPRSRDRSWTLEECSICFDLILRSQEVMSLPCTHQFHQACILPWLQEKQTCPNCRKPID